MRGFDVSSTPTCVVCNGDGRGGTEGKKHNSSRKMIMEKKLV